MRRSLLQFLLLGIGFWVNSYAADVDIINREYQLKTAYLLHFAELTEWPEPTSVTICLQGQSPLRAYLPVLEGQYVHNRVVHVSFIDTLKFDHCQILFVSDLNVFSKALLENAQSRHVLLVSDAIGFARNGGMIQLTLRDNKLKLVVNLPSVKQAGLKLSSKLLRMAEILE